MEPKAVRRMRRLVIASWNLYRGGGDTARARELVYRHAQAKNERNEAARAVEEDARNTWANMMASRERTAAFTKQAEANAMVVSAYKDQFNLDRRTLLDVLDSQNEWFVSRSNAINNSYLEMFAVYRLLALRGELLPTLGVAYPKEANPLTRARLSDGDDSQKDAVAETPASSLREDSNWPLEADRVAIASPLVECLRLLAGHYGRRTSSNALTAGLPIPPSGITPTLFERAAVRADMTARLVERSIEAVAIAPTLPCILVLDHNQACIVWGVKFPKIICRARVRGRMLPFIPIHFFRFSFLRILMKNVI